MNLRAFSRMVQQAAVKPLSQFCRYVPRGRKLAGPAGRRGEMRGGRAIRFVPYPVIGGFLGATGALMIMGAIQVITDQRLTFATAETFLHGEIAGKVLAGVAVAIVLQLLLTRSKSALILPSVLLSA